MHLKTNLGWVLFLLLMPYCASAQILNADGFGPAVDSSKTWSGGLDFGMNLNKQSSLILSFDSKADLAHWYKNNVFLLSGKFALFRTGSQNLINSGFGHLRSRFMVNYQLHPELFTQYQLDGIRGMQERVLLGGNLRWRIQQKKKLRLYLGLGAMYEYERWDYSGVTDTLGLQNEDPFNNRKLKINSYLTYKQEIQPWANFYLVAYVQASPDASILSPRSSVDFRMLFKLSKHIALSVRYSLNYDAAPPVPINKLYYSMVNHLLFTF